ncbi:hypothetical protein B566_EDAN001127 [Ephemera danica]|nr:hypothetical protein B566_EDAN001127 [Ephemera danica]
MAFNLPQNTGFPSASSAAPSFNFGTATTTAAKGFGQPTLGFGSSTSSGFGTAQTSGGFGTSQPSTAFGTPGTSAFGASNTGFGTTATSTGFGALAVLQHLVHQVVQDYLEVLVYSRHQQQIQHSCNVSIKYGGDATFRFSDTTTLRHLTLLTAMQGGNPISLPASLIDPLFSLKMTKSYGVPRSAQQQQPLNQFSLGGPSQQQQQQQQQQLQALEQTDYVTANICGDDRDSTITNWNKLQARWGCGKVVQQPDASNMQSVLTQTLFAGRPQFSLIMHGLRANLGTSHQYLISVTEKQSTGQVRRLSATELATNLSNARTQLSTIGVDNIVPLVAPPKEWIRDYLANPPAGIDRKLWEQAIKDNPDPERLIPTPMVGFADLRARIRSQEMESSKHLSFLQQAEQKVAELKRSMGETEVKLSQRRQALLTLQQRLLALLVKLQVARRSGATLLPVEEELKARLESIKTHISHPSHCKAKLGDIVAQTRLHKAAGSSFAGQYSIDPEALQDFQKFLSMEQEGISRLIDVSMADQNCLKLIMHTLEELQVVKAGGGRLLISSISSRHGQVHNLS